MLLFNYSILSAMRVIGAYTFLRAYTYGKIFVAKVDFHIARHVM